jgi:glycosyltransferase involved in cell wall biosynthesis
LNSNQNEPIVSIVMPVYNGERFLELTIQSVLAQTYKHMEIIAVDDGSTDDSVNLIRIQFPNVKIIQQKNQGSATARNTGLTASTGKYVISLDQDDILDPMFLEKTVNFMEKGDYFGVVTNGYFINTDGIPSKKISKFRNKTLSLYDMCITNQMATTSQVLMDRSKLIDLGGFDTKLRGSEGGPVAEDWELWIRALKKYEFGSLDECLMGYRIHESNNFKKLDLIFKCELKIIDEKMDATIGNLDVFRSYRYLAYAYLASKYTKDWGKARKALWKALKLNPLLLLKQRLYFCYLYFTIQFFKSTFSVQRG